MPHQLAEQILKGQTALFSFLFKVVSQLFKFPPTIFKIREENENLNLVLLLEMKLLLS